MSLPFAGVLIPERSNELTGDKLSDWADGRGESIAADNAITAQIDEDPPSQTTGLDSFTLFSIPGRVFSRDGFGRACIARYLPYQPGFNSIYLPGYTYPPLLLGLMGRGLGMYLPRLPWRTGVSPGVGTASFGFRRAPVPYPAPVRAAPSVVVHGVGHR